MDIYHIWADIEGDITDKVWAENLRGFLESLKEEHKIESYRITRCKLGFRSIQNLPEFDELRAAFSTFDYDCDGSITVEELGQALKTLNVTMNSDDLEAIVEEIDQDQDGKISFDEFLAAAINKEQLLDEKRLNHAFDYFDMDSSGKLDVDELFAITGNMDEARSAIAEYDKDEDGEINFQGPGKGHPSVLYSRPFWPKVGTDLSF